MIPNIHIEIYNSQQTADRICRNDNVGKFVASEWSRYFAKYVPMQSGTLRTNISIEPFKVIYESPYAHYQWEGELYVADNGSSWAKQGEIKHPTGIPLNYNKEQNPLATSHWEVPAYDAFKDVVANSISEYIRRMV